VVALDVSEVLVEPYAALMAGVAGRGFTVKVAMAVAAAQPLAAATVLVTV